MLLIDKKIGNFEIRIYLTSFLVGLSYLSMEGKHCAFASITLSLGPVAISYYLPSNLITKQEG